jgi:hypothetical protein
VTIYESLAAAKIAAGASKWNHWHASGFGPAWALTGRWVVMPPIPYEEWGPLTRYGRGSPPDVPGCLVEAVDLSGDYFTGAREFNARGRRRWVPREELSAAELADLGEVAPTE